MQADLLDVLSAPPGTTRCSTAVPMCSLAAPTVINGSQTSYFEPGCDTSVLGCRCANVWRSQNLPLDLH